MAQTTNPRWLVGSAPGDLKAQIKVAVQKGYHVVSETKTSAQLVKKKQFSCLFATLWFFVFGIGLLIYVFWYMSKKDDMIYLDVETQAKPKPSSSGSSRQT